MDERPEEWRPTEGFAHYEVSDRGRVRSYRRRGSGKPRLDLTPVILAPCLQHGYTCFTMRSVDGRRRSAHLHRLMLTAFVGPCHAGMIARHLDDDRTNNTLANLAWGTYQDNSRDAVRNDRIRCGESHHAAKLSGDEVREIVRLFADGRRQCELAVLFKVSHSTIFKITHGLYRRRDLPRQLAKVRRARAAASA